MKKKKITLFLASLYLIILTWIILFKMQFSLEDLYTVRNINLVPFGESVIINGKIDFDEIIDNVIVFIPVGLYFQMLKRNAKIGKKIGIIAGISLTYEIMQYVLAIGATDITDLISNTFGGFLGLGIYEVFYRLCKNEEKTNGILNVLAMIGTALVVAFLLLLVVMN